MDIDQPTNFSCSNSNGQLIAKSFILHSGELHNHVFNATLDLMYCNSNSCPSSLLTSPDFESGLDGWGVGTSTTTGITNEAYNGTNAAIVTGNDGGVQQAIAGIPGTVYYISAYAKKTGNTEPFIGIEFFDANWDYILGHHLDVTTTTTTTTTTWTEYTHSYIAPANTVI